MFHKESDLDTFIAMTYLSLSPKTCISTLREVYGNNYLVAFCSTLQKRYKKNSFLNLARYTFIDKFPRHRARLLAQHILISYFMDYP